MMTLRPCPFCGSVDLVIDHLVDDHDWFVSCNGCEIQQIANYTEVQAIERWNRRIKPDLTQIVVDVAELPDRTSPDYAPEMMMVTAPELTEILKRYL